MYIVCASLSCNTSRRLGEFLSTTGTESVSSVFFCLFLFFPLHDALLIPVPERSNCCHRLRSNQDAVGGLITVFVTLCVDCAASRERDGLHAEAFTLHVSWR